jgi:hypothetical protein
VGLLFEASSEQKAWSEAAAIRDDLSTDATILNVTKVIIQ